MKLRWTSQALRDLERLHAFLHEVNPLAAARVVQTLTQGAGNLHANPRLGIALGGFEPREVRRIIVARYELRYEIAGDWITILRLWHTREDR